ncbi:MAG: hypothetical protein JO256_04865 [Alphaproteobacteria bacterium]|nr:hypothetical protein [Alphaproteobacteria bacterium]
MTTLQDLSRTGEIDAIVLIKAAPQVGQRHGETVCCAGISLHGEWLRMYPVCFRNLDDAQKFGRWDRVHFKWRKPKDDPRVESLRVDQESITITGSLRPTERARFLGSLIVTSLDKEREKGRSLALLKAQVHSFKINKRSEEDIANDRARFDALRSQPDMFNTREIIPYSPCPYEFKYKYQTDDGVREGTCQDWEMEATYFNLSKQYGEQDALSYMQKTFGEEYPKKGMLLAMGTHSLYPETWLINGVVRLDEIRQGSLPL